jgi:hypothetical protein
VAALVVDVVEAYGDHWIGRALSLEHTGFRPIEVVAIHISWLIGNVIVGSFLGLLGEFAIGTIQPAGPALPPLAPRPGDSVRPK